jgi:hypothetical protein
MAGYPRHRLLVDYGTAFHDLDPAAPDALRSRLASYVLGSAAATERRQRVDVRVYGGWLRDGSYTKLHGQAASALRSDALFPFIHASTGQMIVGSVEFATSLLTRPGFLLDQTLRPRPGMQRLRLHGDLDRSACSSRDGCVALTIYRHSCKPTRLCSAVGCDLRTFEMFDRMEQKMVDGMMICDLLHSATPASGLDSVTLVTSDTDLLPGLISAAAIEGGAQLRLIHPATSPVSVEWGSLQSEGIDMSEAS